jgi:division/cell wall cluster transcriptional repressor MraZ
MAKIFLGNELMRVDQKGRVGIPARFMTVLRAISPDASDSVGLMISPDHSIKIMPMPCFIEEVERWNRLDDQVASERMIKNLATGSTELVQLDKQNRVKLNPLMMEICDIRQQVVIVGSMHYMQLFDQYAWKAMFKAGLSQMGQAMETAAEKDKPKPQPVIKQFIINTAEIEKSAQRQEQDSTERQVL